MPALATFEGRAYALPEVEPDWGLGVILRGNPEGRLEAPFGVPAEAMHGVLRCLAEGERAPVVRTWDGCPPESCLGDVFAAAMYLTQLRWACRVGVEPPAAAPWGVRKACEDANRLLGTWLSALTGFGGGQAVWADTPLPLALVFTGQPGVKFLRRASVNRAVYVPQLQRYATVCPDPVLGAAALSAASRTEWWKPRAPRTNLTSGATWLGSTCFASRRSASIVERCTSYSEKMERKSCHIREGWT